MPLVSVVIPVLNGESTLGAQLEALSKQNSSKPWELIVSDNGSTDGTLDLVEAWRSALPSVNVVDASQHRGVSHARNTGVLAAAGELILVCDADDVADPDWVDAMVTALEKADIVGGTFDEATLNGPASAAWRGTLPSDQLPTAAGFLPYVVGANLGFRKEVFEHIGGWDERYVGGGDDVDFAWRAQLAGFSIDIAPGAVMAYRHRSDLRSLTKQFYRYGKAGPRLYAQYRMLGAERRPIRRALRSWLWLVVHPLDLVGGNARKGRYLRALAQISGRLVGSLQQRVLYL